MDKQVKNVLKTPRVPSSSAFNSCPVPPSSPGWERGAKFGHQKLQFCHFGCVSSDLIFSKCWCGNEGAEQTRKAKHNRMFGGNALRNNEKHDLKTKARNLRPKMKDQGICGREEVLKKEGLENIPVRFASFPRAEGKGPSWAAQSSAQDPWGTRSRQHRHPEHVSVHTALRDGKRTLCFSFSTFKSEKKKTKLFNQPKALTHSHSEHFLPKKQKHRNHYRLNSKIRL